MEARLLSIQAGDGCVGELTIFDRHMPEAAPWAIHLDAEGEILISGYLLIYSILHQNEHVGDDDPGRALVEFALLIAKAPLHIPGVNPVVHDVKSGIEAGGERTHIGMGDYKVGPLIGG